MATNVKLHGGPKDGTVIAIPDGSFKRKDSIPVFWCNNMTRQYQGLYECNEHETPAGEVEYRWEFNPDKARPVET